MDAKALVRSIAAHACRLTFRSCRVGPACFAKILSRAEARPARTQKDGRRDAIFCRSYLKVLDVRTQVDAPQLPAVADNVVL